MAAQNLYSFSTARAANDPPLPVPPRGASGTPFLSQTPTSSSASDVSHSLPTPPVSQHRPLKRAHDSHSRGATQSSHATVGNQHARKRAGASRSSSRPNDASQNLLGWTFISALMEILNLPESVVRDCANRLKSKGKEVTESSLYDECMEFEEKNKQQHDPNPTTSSGYDSLPSSNLSSLPDTVTNQSFEPSKSFASISSNRSSENFQSLPPPPFSVGHSHSGKENARSRTGNRHRSRPSNINAGIETDVKQGLNAGHSLNGFSSDYGYSAMSSGISSDLSFPGQQTAPTESNEDVPDCLPKPFSNKKDSPYSFGNTNTSTSDEGSSSTTLAGAGKSYSNMPRSVPQAAQSSIESTNSPKSIKAPTTRYESSSYNFTPTNNTESTQFNVERAARASNSSSNTHSIPPLSRSAGDQDSGLGLDMVEGQLQSLQLSENRPRTGSLENSQLLREIPPAGNQATAIDEELRHEHILLNLVENEFNLLKNYSLCTACHERPRRAIYLPCGHFITCNECADEINICQLCQETVLATATAILC